MKKNKSKQKQKSRPRKKIARRKGASARFSRPRRSAPRTLLLNSIPRASFTISGSAAGVRLRGVEVFNQLLVSSNVNRSVLPLNPALAQVFPRLSGFALQFEKYRFHKVQIHYHPACPATRSGAVGMAVLTEYVAQPTAVPTYLPELASYEFGCTGTVAGALSTPVWRSKDPEYFFMGQSTGATQALDPLKIFQGAMAFVTRDAVPADNGLVAGYISISYDLELINMRPTVDKFAHYVSDRDFTLPNLGAAIDLGPLNNETGSWLVDKFGSLKRAWQDLTAGVKYVSNIAGALTYVPPAPLGSHAAPVRRVSQNDVKITEGCEVQVYYNPACCPAFSELKTTKSAPGAPMAIGDVVLNLYGQVLDATSPAVLIASKSYSPGATDLAFDFTVPFELDPTVFVTDTTQNGDQPLVAWWTLATVSGDEWVLNNHRESIVIENALNTTQI